MPCWVSSGRSSSCWTRTYLSLSTSVREVVAVDDLPARALRQREIVGDLGVRQDDHVVPAQPALSPPVVLLNEVAQRIAGFAGLADRFDLVLVTASALPPCLAVVPDLTALDLKTDDASALDRHDEIDLVVLEMVGDALAGNHPVVGLKLFEQSLVDRALGAVGKARSFVRRDCHTSGTVTVASAPMP